MNNSTAFVTITMLPTTTSIRFQNIFIAPKGDPVPSQQCSPLPTPPPNPQLATSNLCLSPWVYLFQVFPIIGIIIAFVSGFF